MKTNKVKFDKKSKINKSNIENNFKNYRKNKIVDKKIFVYGKNPSLLCLENKKRTIYKIYTSNIEELEKFIEQHKIKIDKNKIFLKTNQEINNFVNKEDINHQGYLLEVSNREKINLNTFLDKECSDKKNLPKLLVLDEITDPHNVGAIIRTAVAFNINYIITTTRNSVNDSSVVIKTSAGYSELVNIIEVGNLNKSLEELKKVGYYIIGLTGETDNNIKNIKDNSNLCLVLGNEGKGIRQLVKKNCDFLYKININNNVESLNVSVACAIAIYQIWS